ncbi:MAG: FAD-dependent oxidoreductase [Clostridia bacterium]|nr:FAD-dependent oxidoreductase [Clostridia bacterium]
MKSLWIDTAKRPEFDALKGDAQTDVLIIGGGITGILCARMLEKSAVDYILVEADRICSGVTENTTAKLTFQHGLIYSEIIKKYSEETALKYLLSQKQAVEEFSNLCKETQSDFAVKDSYVYSLDDREKIEQEVKALNKLGVNAEFCEKTKLPFSVAGAVKVENQAQIHPLRVLFSVAKGMNIFENTRVIAVDGNTAVTQYGKIRAKKIIFATHFPFIDRYGAFFVKMYQHRSYVIALKNASDFNGLYVDEAEKGLSFRNHGEYLLLGGGSHRTGKNGGNWKELEAFAKKYFPASAIEYRWATQDCMTLDSIPYIGQYSRRTPDYFAATGFNKWGMSSAMAAAMILCDLVQDRKNEYASVYSPGRSMLHPQLAANAVHFIADIVIPKTPRCPHLGCALRYNAQEHSWDCPCHGSRFDEDGGLINGPSNKNLNK